MKSGLKGILTAQVPWAKVQIQKRNRASKECKELYVVEGGNSHLRSGEIKLVREGGAGAYRVWDGSSGRLPSEWILARQLKEQTVMF